MTAPASDPEARLLEAWRAYRRAQLGQLGETADALREAAKACGWVQFGLVRMGFAPWAYQELLRRGLIETSESPWS